MDQSILRNLFLLRLPLSIRTSLAAMLDKPLAQLDQIADTLVEIAPPSIATIKLTSQTQLNYDSCVRLTGEIEHLQSKLLQVEPATQSVTTRTSKRVRSPSSSSHRRVSSPARQTVCWYHTRFGSKASKCHPPCTFSSNWHASH